MPLAVKRAIRNLCRRCRPGAPGSRVEGAGGAFDENPREATSKNAGPGGFPTAFDSKSGAPAASEAPGALPIKIQRSHLQKSGAPRRHPGRRMARRGRRAPRVGGYAGKRATTGRPYDSGRTKWARGSGRSHSTTCPAAKERGTSMSRWLVLPRNRAA